MTYHWSNRKNILKNAKDKYHNKGGKKNLLSIVSQIKKF